MSTNLDHFKDDLKRLITTGDLLELAIQNDCFPEQFKRVSGKQDPEAMEKIIKSLPSFRTTYQRWYSEVIGLLRQTLPDRVEDFTRYYEKPKTRKDITYENYRIEDYLQGLKITRGYDKEVVVGPDAAIPLFRQQLAILKAVEARFESSLFEIRQLVQADLFDSELEASEELLNHKFIRAAGALAGVVLEGHLTQVCSDRKITITKKNPGISDLSELLKTNGAIGVPEWRFIQHLADIRNLCDHNKKIEPTNEQVSDLISGVKKITKTIY